MSPHPSRGIGAALVAALSLFLGAGFAGGTTIVPSDVQQTVTLPLTGVTHFIPPDSCRKAGWAEEDISWAGWIVIENKVGFDQGHADVQAKLALVDLVGVGHSSGWDYSSTGSFAMRSVPQVSVIAASLSGSAPFNYFPNDSAYPDRPVAGCQIYDGLGVGGSILFNADGTVLAPVCNSTRCTSGTHFSISNIVQLYTDRTPL